MLGTEVLDGLLCEVGMALDLVDRRHHRGLLEERVEVLDHEVADADRADLAVGEQRLQGAVGLERPVERRRERLMQDQQVDLLDAELPGALLEGVQRFVVAVVADPDLGLHEHVGAVKAGAVNRLADLAFVAVRGGGVDVPIPGLECSADGVTGLVGGCLEDAEAEGGYLDAVVQGQERGGEGSWSDPSLSSWDAGVQPAWPVGRTRISLSDTPRGRETANAMISAMSCAAIDVCSYICSAAALVSLWVMWSVSSVATAPGSITITRTSGCSCWRSDSDQPFTPHFVAA